MIGRHVARARGRALRAAGVPRTPNLPSGRALVRRELRAATSPVRVTGGRSSSGSSGPAVGRRCRTEDDGPGALPALVAVVGLVVAVYLLVATGVPDDPPTVPAETCADRVVYHAARLRDC